MSPGCVELGRRVLAIDFDPQSNLTAMFIDEKNLEEIWTVDGENQSLLKCISPIIDGLGDIAQAPLQQIREGLHLLPGDLGLSHFEDKLSDSWPRCLDGDKAAFRVITALHRIIHQASQASDADIVLIDVGPNFGAINRAALIASDHVVVPLAPSPFSLQGLKNLGPMLRDWREAWRKRMDAKPDDLNIPMPAGAMKPAGYVIMQHVERRSRPVRAFQSWVSRIPVVYETHVLEHGGSRLHRRFHFTSRAFRLHSIRKGSSRSLP